MDQNPHDNKLIIQVSADSEEARRSINLIMKDYSIIWNVPKKTCFCHVIEVIENESLKIFDEFLSGHIVEEPNPTNLEERFTFSFLKTTKKTDIFSKIINLSTSQPFYKKKYLVGSSAEKNHIPKEFAPNFCV